MHYYEAWGQLRLKYLFGISPFQRFNSRAVPTVIYFDRARSIYKKISRLSCPIISVEHQLYPEPSMSDPTQVGLKSSVLDSIPDYSGHNSNQACAGYSARLGACILESYSIASIWGFRVGGTVQGVESMASRQGSQEFYRRLPCFYGAMASRTALWVCFAIHPTPPPV